MPTTLFLSDGFGTVTLTYGPALYGPAPGFSSWWGCAARTVTGGTLRPGNDCAIIADPFSQNIFFQLQCGSTTAPGGYYLRLWYPTCSDPIAPATHIWFKAALTCTSNWSGQASAFYIGGAGPLPFIVTQTDCSPFSVTFTQAAFPTTSPNHALREVYGSSATFTVTE